MQIDFIYTGMDRPGPVPYGVILLSAILEKEGHDLRVIDLDGKRITAELLRKSFDGSKPDIICLSLMTTPTLGRAAAVFDLIPKIVPSATVVVGGPHATIFPEELLREFPCIDVVIHGEGDISLPRLVHAFDNGRSLGSVKGIYYRENGVVRHTGAGDMLDQPGMDKSPFPAFQLIDLYRHNYVYIIESYGCPFRCSFCYTHIHKHYRTKNPKRVIEDIVRMVENHKIRVFKFWDDLPFGANRKKMIEFCEELVRRNLRIKWSCVTRPELYSQEVIEAMISAGCFRVSMGVESGSPRMLKLLNKKNTPEKYMRVFELLSKYDIISSASLMLGLPGEELDDLQLTVDLAKNIRATEYFPQNYKPYPGTELFRLALERGFKPPQTTLEWSRYSDFTKYNVNVSNVSMDDIISAKKTIEGLNDWFKNFRIVLKAIPYQLREAPAKEAKKFLSEGLRRIVSLLH